MSAVSRNARDLANLVLVEAVGSSATPFVPLPFVDDWLFARLLRRTTRKVIERTGRTADERLAKSLVEGYLREGDPGLGSKALTTAARFVVRKAAVVLDVKRSHDVFGETIVYALALDHAVELGALGHGPVADVGGAIYRATQRVGSAMLEIMTRAGREAWTAEGAATSGGRLARVADAIARQVDETHANLAPLMREELVRPPRR